MVSAVNQAGKGKELTLVIFRDFFRGLIPQEWVHRKPSVLDLNQGDGTSDREQGMAEGSSSELSLKPRETGQVQEVLAFQRWQLQVLVPS